MPDIRSQLQLCRLIAFTLPAEPSRVGEALNIACKLLTCTSGKEHRSEQSSGLQEAQEEGGLHGRARACASLAEDLAVAWNNFPPCLGTVSLDYLSHRQLQPRHTEFQAHLIVHRQGCKIYT